MPSSLNLGPCTYPLLPLPTHPRYLSTDQSCRYAIKSARMLVPGNDWRGISATYQVRLLLLRLIQVELIVIVLY